MVRSTTSKLCASFVATALLLAACGDDTESSGGAATTGGQALRVNWGGFPESWAPGAEMEAGYMRVPYENLVKLGSDGAIEPMLASGWEETDTALTLTLRDDVVFHDDTPFDAEAVKANIETIKSTPGPYAGPFQVIESVEVVDEQTVQLNLTEATPSLLTTLSTRAAPMASPQAIEDGSIAQNPVGTGPWAYDPGASAEGTRMTFSYFEDYWGGRDSIGFETIELYAIPEDNQASGALTSGEIDLTDTEQAELANLEGAGNIDSLTYPAIRNNVIFFDRGPGGLFEDADVRRAACYAMDPQVLVDLEPGDFEAGTQHFVDGEPGYSADIEGYPHDLEEAQDLYEQAGSPEIQGEVLAAPYNEAEMQVYMDQIGELGIDISVQGVPPPQFATEWNSGRYPLGLSSNDELTPYDWYQSWFAANAPGNPSGVESDELQAAADAAIAAGSTDEAAGLWEEVMGIISDEALTCSFLVAQELVAWNTDTVEGVQAPLEPWEPNSIDFRSLQPAGS